jgi:hypothetical protein
MYRPKLGQSEDVPLWARMYHFYKFNAVEFNAHYHKRSNVESTFQHDKIALR